MWRMYSCDVGEENSQGSLPSLRRPPDSGSFVEPLHASLAGVQQVLQLHQVSIRGQQVHAGLVVVNEEVAVGLQVAVHLLLQDLVVEPKEANKVVQVLVVHVEGLVGGLVVQHRQVLVDQKVLVELAVLQLHVIHVPVHHGVQGDDSVQEVARALLVEQLQAAGTTDHHRGDRATTQALLPSHLSVLTHEHLQRTSDLLHGLVLRARPHTGHGQTDVHGRPLPTSEQLGVQVDLPVRDTNHVGNDVSRHIVGQGLHNGQRRQRTRALLGGHHGRALQQPGVQVEHITGVRLSAGRSSQQQGNLTVGNGLLGKVIVDAQNVAPVVTEVLPKGGPGEGRQVLQPGGVGSRGSDNGGVAQGIVVGKQPVDAGHVGAPLADGDVHAEHIVLAQGLVVHLHLVDDGGHGNGGLPGLSVPQDQLSLPSPDGDQGVNNLETSEQVVVHGLARHNVGGIAVHKTLGAGIIGGEQGGGAGEQASGDLGTQRVDHLAQHVEPHGDHQQLIRGEHGLPRPHPGDVVQQDHTNGPILLQVEGDSVGDAGGGDLDLQHGVEGYGHLAPGRGNGGHGSVNAVGVANLSLGLDVFLRWGAGIAPLREPPSAERAARAHGVHCSGRARGVRNLYTTKGLKNTKK
eukprot:RCo031741